MYVRDTKASAKDSAGPGRAKRQEPARQRELAREPAPEAGAVEGFRLHPRFQWSFTGIPLHSSGREPPAPELSPQRQTSVLQLHRYAGDEAVGTWLRGSRLSGSSSGPLATTQDGQTTIRAEALMHSRLAKVAAHEFVHRAQFRATGAPLGGAAELEADAAAGAETLLAGGKYQPKVRAACGVVLGYPDGNATLDPETKSLAAHETAGNAATTGWLQSLQGGVWQFKLPGPTPDVVAGPLPVGSARESHGLTVEQTDHGHAEINYGDSRVAIAAAPGDVYAFTVGPPIAGPPQPPPPMGPLLSLGEQDTKPPLPQRVVRVSATANVVDEHLDETARVAPLAVQTRIVSAAEVHDMVPEIPSLDVIEWTDAESAQLQLEESMIRIEAPADADAEGQPGAGSGHPPFAYWIDPEWTGPHHDQHRVTIVAAPGVTVKTGLPAHAPAIVYGRSLAYDVVRVPHRALVPQQGSRISLEQFVGVDTVDPQAGEALPIFPGLTPTPGSDPHRDAVNIGTGLAGVTIVHPWSEARVSVRPTDPGVGAAYAWQVLAPMNGRPGEIRVVVGPGVTVSVAEPVPYRLRERSGLPTPTPKPGQALTGEGLAEQAFEFQLIEVADPVHVPVQGTPLNMEYLAGFGRYREPDQHAWLGTDDLPFRLATTGFDMIVGLIPIVGQLYLIGEFTYTMVTGHDWWGNEVDDGGKVLMGMGAALSLIPVIGGLRALLTGAAEATKVAEFAARWGMTVEELQTVLARVGTSVTGEDAALVQRAVSSLEKGGRLTEEEVTSLRSILGRVGAGGVAFEGVSLSATGQLELALASGGTPLRSENYLAQILSEVRTTGKVSDDLIAPLARSGQFGNAEEAEMAIRQALRDLARAEGVAADEALINAAARTSGEAVVRAQTAAVEASVPQSRTLAVSQPQLVARYQELVNQRLPQVMQDVLAGQRPTANRARLAQLRQQFDQLRSQVGDSQRLTQAQRDLANDLLREARDLASDDFGTVRKAVWRRLRDPRRNPDLAQIEQQLRAAGDVGGPRTGALRVRMTDASGTPSFDSMNIEHRVRLSDNPWGYNEGENLIVSDAAQNQQYLEALRQSGSIWPTDAVEEFVVRFRLNDQFIDFAPGTR
jgi:hypothetical protein